jgi:ATP-dependent protease HslVU (ClpYQ) peptidase subunit
VTVIAYRNGIMVADSRAFGGRGEPSPGIKRKIRKLADGTLIGVSTGTIGGGEHLINWYESGCGTLDVHPDNYDILVVKPNGDIFLAKDGLHFSGPLTCKFGIAIGSGNQYAMAALLLGKSAKEAVQVAIKLDCFSAGPLFSIKLNKEPGKCSLNFSLQKA